MSSASVGQDGTSSGDGRSIPIAECNRWLFNSLSDVVWRIDDAWRWVYANQAVESVYGSSPTSVIGKSFKAQFASERRQIDVLALERVFAGAELVDYETVILDRLGSPKHVRITAHPIRDGLAIVGVEGVTRDVTETTKAIEALDKAREAAEQAAEAKASLLANMSHEIRTPMNGVLGMIDVLLASDLDADQRRSADLIKTSAQSLLSLLNDVLDFSRIEAEGLRLEETRFDIHALVDSVVRVMAVSAFEKGVEMAYDIRPDVPRFVRGDPGRLRQVVSNLLGNAVKFTPKGEIVVTVSVDELNADDVELRCSVRDTGVGISRERLESIFEDYTQSSLTTAREFGGTGLGLAISRRLARMMGGDITVESGPDQGSNFLLTARVTRDERRSHQPPDNPTFTDLRVLVVGSNSASRGIICDILKHVGIESFEAHDADSAKELLLSDDTRCDIALIDSYLPGRDGFALARSLKEHSHCAHVELMLLMSAGQRGDAARCRDIGVAAYLTKPVSRSDLLEAIAAVRDGAVKDISEHDVDLVTRHSIAESRESLRVLVVEDNPVNQAVASSMLRKRGHIVEIVDNGRDAVDAVERGSHHVILMDVQLPVMDGFEAASAIRAIPGQKTRVPIVAVTAYGVEGVQERCLTAGFDRFLLKPFQPHELFSAVEGWGNGSVDSPHPEKVEAAAPVDREALTEIMAEAGVAEAVDGLLGVFVSDAPGRMTDLVNAVERLDVSGVEAAAHVFRSAAVTIRASRLAELLDEVEWNARAGSVSRATDIMPEVETEFESVMSYLSDSGVCIGGYA